MSSGGGGDDAGDGGRAEWQRIYDRVEALAAGRARLEARNRIQHEFWDARLHQAELSRSRWEAACRELLPSDDPKLAELLESDLEDSRTCEALLDTENSELLAQLKEDGTCVELNENTADHDHNSGDLISDLRKLKRTYETICWNKDKEATEAVQKLQQNIEELQVAARKKDDEIGRLQAEASASTNKILVLEGELNEMHSSDKENDIQKLKVGESKTLKRKLASLSTSLVQASVLGKAELLSKANDSINDLKLKLDGLEGTLSEAKACEETLNQALADERQQRKNDAANHEDYVASVELWVSRLLDVAGKLTAQLATMGMPNVRLSEDRSISPNARLTLFFERILDALD
ncbi:lamin-C isoform X3 [Triticum aestivum]|uniref:lamin-C isoform X3 n=1 Tax=Triticum aestivum TaxID=4565 RepID=UPI001D026D3D|nr:lamin-C-like isoform X3 [Triticum aestivum]